MATGETMQAMRDQVEELALMLVLGDESSILSSASLARFAAALEDIGVAAERSRCPSTAGIAATLREAIETGRGSAELEETLRKGIGELQRSAESDVHAESNQAPVAPAQDPELVSDFVVEAREHLEAVETQSLVLEQDPGNSEAINAVFRGFHTIKGLAGFLELTVIQEVAHEVETVLDQARNGQLAISPNVIDVVLQSADYLGQSISAVEASLRGTPAPCLPAHGALIVRIKGILSQDEEPLAPKLALSSGELLAATATTPQTAMPAKVEAAAALDPKPPEESAPVGEPKAGKRQESTSLRVDASKLDYLMDMVGEMVIAQSLLHNETALKTAQNPRLQRNLVQLARTTSEVQRTAMSMRMVPIGNLFQRMARLVRDLSRKTGKQVNLETTGEDTELDKTIAEELADPLMHMVRNALDHGIEDSETRRAAGKNATASVFLGAYHQSGYIVVEVGDDGRGLDRQKILAKAVQRGLVKENAELTDAEVHNLIFEPGFSTAAQVTDVSGRGVGMDVVRKHIQKLRGRIDIHSTCGQGTRFLLKLPLTLAMIDGLVVGVGAYRYVVPIFAVREMFRPARDQIFTVENRDEMILVRGRLLPLVRLYRRFGVKPKVEDPAEALVIVTEAEGRQFCLMVDELVGKQEVVIKGLGETLKNIVGVAGGAILGDGRVGLILDMGGVFGGKAA
jgi:two-component system chemotaxis sensor kinase CheA